MAKTVDRRRDHARRARRRGARSERSGDAPLHAAARARLHAVPERATASRARASASRARSSTIARHAAGRSEAARRPERRADEGDGRGDRRAQAAGRGHRRSRRHSRASSTRIRRTTSSLWNQCSGADEGRGQGRELLDRLQVRHEARLQRVAGVARPGGAGEDADRAARVEHRARRRRARSSTASRTSTSPTRWTSSAIARATRPIARRTSGSAATHGIDEVMKAERLDALLFPGGERRRRSPRGRAIRRSSCRSRSCRMRRRRAFPAGFDAKPQPFGVSFTGMACSEPRLIELAYAFEQATKKRVPPPLFPEYPERQILIAVVRRPFVIALRQRQ